MKTSLSVKVVVAVVCSILFLTSQSSCTPSGKSASGGRKRIKVITTLFPLYDMARHIGGDKAEVSLLLPPGVEAHSFEPKPGDILKINEADIFIYTGKFMEPWVEGIIKSVAHTHLLVIDASEGTKMIASVFHDKDEPAGSPDPHIWLDFDNSRIMAKHIAKAFQSRDSAHGDFYEKNAAEYAQQLTALDHAYKTALFTCKKKEIIYAGHYAFGYLADRYGLKYIAAQGVSPDAEPTAKDLVRLVNQIRKDKTRYLFYEELTSPKIAETLADETGAKMLLLNAAHNLARDQFEKGISFFDILRRDLDNLKIGLECE